MINKIKDWFVKTGLRNLGWAAACAGMFIFIGGSVGTFLAGACAGMFIHYNYGVIKKLIMSI